MKTPNIIDVPSSRARVIALRSPQDQTVVAHGISIRRVIAKARKAGATDPVLVFVPKPGKSYTY